MILTYEVEVGSDISERTHIFYPYDEEDGAGVGLLSILQKNKQCFQFPVASWE